MNLYSLTLQQSTSISQAVYGNFSAPKKHEIVLAKGKVLELLRPDEATGKLLTVYKQEIFGAIRSIAPFRLTGLTTDFLVVGTDSGRIAILEFKPEKEIFDTVHQETFGKTGCRRIIPGEFLAVDPKGRAVMIGAIEKQKFVYILNRENNEITISSPLEAHKPHNIVFDMCGIDVGYDNPNFAAIEIDYGESDSTFAPCVTGKIQKNLVIYELELGLNHVIRKYVESVDETAHRLLPVPAESDGPGGVIVVCENFMTYKKENHDDRECPIPRRNDMDQGRNLFCVAYTLHKQRNLFFFLIQSDCGDLYKVTMNFTDDQVHSIQCQYYDTINTSTSLCILKTGFMFAASEFGNHWMYQITSLGDDDENPVIADSTMDRGALISFNARKLKNIAPVDEIKNMGCITQMECVDLLDEGNPQIYATCGRSALSTLRIVRHGLQINQDAAQEMPATMTGIWTLKERFGDDFDKYMVASFEENTLVLSIGSKISEVTDSGFNSKTRTIHACLMQDDSMIQISPKGIIHITPDKRKSFWESSKGNILHAASNEKQIIISCEGGELTYFELDTMTSSIAEIETKTLSSEITCLDVGPIQEGRQRSKFIAVGCEDKILLLDPESGLNKVSVQALPTIPSDVCLIEMKNSIGAMDIDQTQLFLHIGLSNGLLLRAAVDSITGNLSDSRSRYLGTKPVSLIKVVVHGLPAMLALSSRPWFCYNFMSKYFVAPLSYDPVHYASSFSSELRREGMVGILDKSLRIFSVDKLGEMFNEISIPLKYTPRSMVCTPSKKLVIVETDHLTYPSHVRDQIRDQVFNSTHDEEYKDISPVLVGYPKAPLGTWASSIRVLDPGTHQTLHELEFSNNESAFSCIVTDKLGTDGKTYCIVGTAKDLQLHPRSCKIGFIYVYTINEDHQFTFVHKTPTEDLPMCFEIIGNRLIAGIGNTLRVYAIGQKKLLRKCENRKFQSAVNKIRVDGSRVFATDQADSVHVLKYKPEECQLYIFADDVIPRWITDFTLLDYDTIVGCDKFENVFVLRLPPGCEEDAEDDPTSTKFKWEAGYLSGAAYKFEQIGQFHVGEVITSIKKCRPTSIGTECILFTTTMGSIGALVPFEYKEDVDFFLHLEMYLRLEALPLCGREHVSFRSAYVPVKNVIDGDLCEQFASLDFKKQKALADELDRHPMEVLKKLEEARNKIM